MGNSERKLSKEEKDNKELVYKFYNSTNYTLTKKSEREIFYNVLSKIKIKSMAIGFCPLKALIATLSFDSAIHAYAFFEFEDAEQNYMGLIIEYGPYESKSIREDYYFLPIYPFGDGLRYGLFLREMFDKMSYLNKLKSSIIHINNKLTLEDIISKLNSGIPWNKKAYNLLTHNCQDLIVKLIYFLEAELLEENNIINKNYSVERRVPDKILKAFRDVTLKRIENNLPVKNNNIIKNNNFETVLLYKDIGLGINALINRKKGIKNDDEDNYYKSTSLNRENFEGLKQIFNNNN